MPIELRLRTGLLLLLAVVTCITAVSVVTGAGDTSEAGADADVETVTLEDGAEYWPYTSRARDAGQRTLPINLIVYGDPELTEAMLRHSTIGDWEDPEAERQDVAPTDDVAVGNATTPTIAWGGADGATRWTYVEGAAGDGTWLSESYQLHDGDFLGARHHVRAYVDPEGGDWTAMQAHREHWDWFHLRHTVHGVEDSQTHVEAEFLERPYIADLHRDRFGNDAGADADGWVTVVSIDAPVASLLGLFVLGSFGAVGRAEARERLAGLYADESVRRAARSALVVGSLVALYAAVRFGSIWIERSLPALNPWVLVYAFYPILVVGMPVVAYLSARRLGGVRAFTAAAIGFTLAVLLDYTYLGISVLPIETIVHRAALAIAIGFVAAGASRTARSPDVHGGHVRTGVLLWLVAIAIPFLQFV